MNRRSFIKNSSGLLIAAPMVVRAESIMRVRTPAPSYQWINMDSFYDIPIVGDYLSIQIKQEASLLCPQDPFSPIRQYANFSCVGVDLDNLRVAVIPAPL